METSEPGAKPLDWRDVWYPVHFAEDLPAGPLRFRIHDLSLVLWRDGDGRLACLADRCPHRAARLSDGRVVDGRLECMFHGWQFGADGRCLHIPQLAEGAPIPGRACVRSYAVVERQGLVWVWAGDASQAAEDRIPIVASLDAPGVRSLDFAIDLPYAQDWLVENVIDLAHIHIAHDGIRGGGRRELARPIEFEVLEDSARAIRARLPAAARGTSGIREARVSFVAPNLVWYETDYQDPGFSSGLALYSLPTGTDRCRLLYRAYSNFPTWRERITPRAVLHWTQCTILEQDMQLVIGQSEEVEAAGVELRDLWLPLRTSDDLVVRYRRWMDVHGPAMQRHVGFETSRRGPRASAPERGRLALHTRICRSCGAARRTARLTSRALFVLAFALLAAGTFAGGSWISASAAGGALVAGALAVVARRVQSRFE